MTSPFMDTGKKQAEFLGAYDKYADAIFRHCYFRVSNHEQALDLTQEAFTRTWEYMLSGDEIKNMKAFIYRVANNLIVDHFRKKKSYSLDEMIEAGFDPPDGVDHAAGEAQLDARIALSVLDKLDPNYRDVITLRYVDDLAPFEIAEILGETENAVSVRIHRGLKKAKELLIQKYVEHEKKSNS